MTLRYIYIVKKAWLDEKFPDSSSLLKVSLSALVILVLWNASSGLGVAIYYGYPQIKVMDMAIEKKMKCTTIVMINLILMISVSCWCYFKILRHNGKFGNNSVGIIGDADTSEVMPNGLFVIDNFRQELSARENIEMNTFTQIQRQAKIKKQQEEIDSAILSLKTNLSFILILSLLYVLGIFVMSDTFSLLFVILKSQAPVVTSVINFVKIRMLMMNVCNDYLTWVKLFIDRIFCI
jgi:hypothetical protein